MRLATGAFWRVVLASPVLAADILLFSLPKLIHVLILDLVVHLFGRKSRFELPISRWLSRSRQLNENADGKSVRWHWSTFVIFSFL